MKEYQNRSWYVLQFALGNAWDFECLAGSWFSDDMNEDMPWVGMKIQSNPASPRREEIRASMRSWSEPKGGNVELADTTNWWRIGNGKPPRAFLGEDDQIRAFKPEPTRQPPEA